MLKARATLNGKDTLLVGLSHKNLAYLKAGVGEPYIRISGEEMELPLDIIIFSGQDEEAMARMVAPGITEATKIRVGPLSRS